MQIPVTRHQLLNAVESYGFRTREAEQIVKSLEDEGRLDLTGSMLKINNPTDPDAATLIGLAQRARGASPGSVGDNKIHEYLSTTAARSRTHGGSRRV